MISRRAAGFRLARRFIDESAAPPTSARRLRDGRLATVKRLPTINPQKDLFSKIEAVAYDILVPFVCVKTGGCCSIYMPLIPERHLMQIAHDLHQDEGELFDAYMSRFRKNMTSHPEPCIFLDQHNLCRIYEHPLRPDVCRLYPFSYEGGAEKCPSYQEHKRLLKILFQHCPLCQIYDASFCPNLDVRRIPDQDWPEILEIFRAGRPFAEMERKFIEWNHQPQGGDHATPRED
jgi:Fe-S-cluster containining protein